jgi:alkanesulfonate monooxygenase SsuD/methylene tetrahydromethanopterin reductase-like flavin-dependent oxidoreductase (luciferase family)
MQCGFVLPDIDLKNIGNLAREVEEAGWDGVFVPDCISIQTKDFPAFPFHDPWVALGLVAVATSRIRFGTMVTAMPRRRPWKLARETMTLDHLSNGRLILAVGLGAAADDAGFYKVGEKMDLKSRAELLDEGLEILAGCWSGKPFSFHGKHYQVDDMTLAPPPVQSPRIPVWVVGVWPKTKSVNRALRWDGIIPQKYKPGPDEMYMKPEEIADVRDFVKQNRKEPGAFEIIASGTTPGDDRKRAFQKVQPYAEAGATWWLEAMWGASTKEVRTRIQQGPPRE